MSSPHLIPALWLYSWLISTVLPTSHAGSHSCITLSLHNRHCCDSVMLDLKYRHIFHLICSLLSFSGIEENTIPLIFPLDYITI